MERTRRSLQIGFLVCLTAIIPIFSLEGSSPAQTIQPFAASCRTDDEIPSKDRQELSQVAIEFVQKSLGPNPEAAYSAFTADAKGSLDSEKFVATFKQGIQRMGPFKDLHVVRTYLANVRGGSEEQWAICGNLSSPNGWVTVKVKLGPPQAHLIVEAQSLNNTWGFVLWLLPEQGIWHVQYVQVVPTAIVGKTAEDFQIMAESEIQKNHNFNAFILYGAALRLAGRGPFFQLGILQEIQKGADNMKPPRDLPLRPPYDWHFGQSSFKILSIGPIGVGQKIYLQVDQEIVPWADDKDADKRNHDLILAIAKAYPEYKDAFAGIVVRAHERGGSRGFGTVFENDADTK